MSITKSMFHVIFDVGGVVVRLNLGFASKEFQRLSGCSAAVVASFLTEEFSGPVDGYSLTEKAVAGLNSKEAYISAIHAALDGRMSVGAIQDTLIGIIGGQDERILPILDQLEQAAWPISCFSNADQLHWEYILAEIPIIRRFGCKMASFEEGVVKPTREAYSRMVDKVGVAADKCIFVDDRLDNVRAADAFGMKALHYTGPGRLLGDFRRLGLPPNRASDDAR
jgi:hypothetical protein